MIAALMMGGLGILVGAGLAFASKIFYVYVDPKITAIDEALPGANCGGCGLPGCSANAEAIVAGTAAPNSCVAAGPEVAEEIAGILGVKLEAKEPDIALPGCTYGVESADTKYYYDGLNDCRAATLLGGGMKVCTIGCVGLGTCARACPFDAIVMGAEGLPVVNEDRCTGCGTCERVCPKHIITLSSTTRRILKEYTTDDCTTPCQRKCPAGIDICEYIRWIGLGDYARAVQVIKERLPFPAIIGRICPRPCETDCRRQLVDEPVAINALKRFVADFEMQNKTRIQPYKAPETGRRIAVVGGGVEGLSTAFFTARLGHDVTVFEASSQPGGLLNSAIAQYRLPREILEWDIAGIVEMGVAIETDAAIGGAVTVQSLLAQGFESIFVATGGWDSRKTRQEKPAETTPIPGTYLLIDLMKESEVFAQILSSPSRVVINGGGALALQAVQVLKRFDVENITFVFNASTEGGALDPDIRVKLEKEGVHVMMNAVVGRLNGSEKGLENLEIKKRDSDNAQIVPTDVFFMAAGRYPEMIITRERSAENEAETEKITDNGPSPDMAIRWEGIVPYKKPEFQDSSGLLAPGDALSDYSAAVKAIGAGRRAAASIHQWMYDFEIYLPENAVTPESNLQDVDHLEGVKSSARRIMPLKRRDGGAPSGEIETGYSEEMAKAESTRCLQCGLICYRQTAPAPEENG